MVFSVCTVSSECEALLITLMAYSVGTVPSRALLIILVACIIILSVLLYKCVCGVQCKHGARSRSIDHTHAVQCKNGAQSRSIDHTHAVQCKHGA